MTQSGLKISITCWIVITILVGPFLLVWYLWEAPSNTNSTINRTKTVVHLSHRDRGERSVQHAPSTAVSSCAQTERSRALTVCIPDDKTSTLLIPFTSLISDCGQRGSRWGYSYSWYATIGQGWDTLIGETDHNWSTHSTGNAARICKLLKMSKFSTGLNLTIIANHLNLDTTVPCLEITLWVYSSDRDPNFPVFVCKSINRTEPIMNSQTRDRGVKIALTKTTFTPDDWFHVTTGVSAAYNNWLLLVEQAAEAVKTDCVVCLGPRPILRVVPAAINVTCLVNIMYNTNPWHNCSYWDAVYPITPFEKEKPIFDKHVAKANYSCIRMTGDGEHLDNLTASWCVDVFEVNNHFQPVSRGDVWWWCGKDKLYDRLPRNVIGHCALVSLLLPTTIHLLPDNHLPHAMSDILSKPWSRYKRSSSWKGDSDPTYIDAIGVPRGVPSEYKLADQIASGFESFPILSAIFPVTPNKNVDRINYIHYNVQKLGNYTQAGFEAVHEQLAATSLMAFQNRIALDMLLAEKSVCEIFGDQCCTFIPNNTASDGSLTRTIEGLRTLNKRLKEQSGVDQSMWDDWMDVFGKYKSIVSSALISVAIFAGLLTLCGCCCIPCIRELLNRLITTAIAPHPDDKAMQAHLLAGDDLYIGDSSSLALSHLFEHDTES
ncbi:hypothetical protein NL108_018600 [Boleophthalmus pectinirostris]|nr:hypothetical protein NL108_018600 [Boleophthalmus pectinirostris]